MAIFGLLPMSGGAGSIKLAPKLFLMLIVAFFLLGVGGTVVVNAESATATFAAGCFWCIQEPFNDLPGVTQTAVGFSGGTTVRPSYKEVTAGGTGHYEAVQVTYDPEVVSYRELLDIFWRNIDPLDAGGQFCDRGTSYRAAIFYHDGAQRRAARQSLNALEDSGRFQEPIVTEIKKYDAFYLAEDYHQNYYKKNANRYKVYRYLCGRDARLRELWGRS